MYVGSKLVEFDHTEDATLWREGKTFYHEISLGGFVRKIDCKSKGILSVTLKLNEINFRTYRPKDGIVEIVLSPSKWDGSFLYQILRDTDAHHQDCNFPEDTYINFSRLHSVCLMLEFSEYVYYPHIQLTFYCSNIEIEYEGGTFLRFSGSGFPQIPKNKTGMLTKATR